MSGQRLITGGADRPLLSALRHAISHATDIEIAVSFIKVSGLDLIFKDIETALLSQRQVRLRLLTSDYLCVTDPRALRKLMLLAERGADIRIFEVGAADSFHLKAYIFVRSEQGELVSADAFVGSSNISKIALTDGLEWNYHIDYPNDADLNASARITEIRSKFAGLLQLPQVRALSYEWIEQYERRYAQRRKVTPIIAVAPGSDEPEPDIPEPRLHQQEALLALTSARARGARRGLVVLATGMGKTYLAAFDASQFAAGRVLFVAHREEILLQAEESFLAVLPNRRIGRYTGKQKDSQFDLLFASVQTLGRTEHLQRFAPDYFSYVVVDEFHHAAASSYQKLINYFTPQFLLGLTATPERTDNSDILQLCDHNLVYRMDLFDGISTEQLCPFRYYGIYDAQVDYEHIPWRNGRFDPAKLSNKLATLGRARHAIKEWRRLAGQKTLVFCASIAHADFMAQQFNREDIAAVSVHTESDITRSEALEQLTDGTVNVLFSVDLFSEGVDMPSIDTVMMLRPTESKILFLQQLGRGLRLAADKPHLVVLDFVGNHQSFLNRPELLLGNLFDKAPNRSQLIKALREERWLLPDGCFIHYDLKFIEFLQSLAANHLSDDYFKLKENLKRRPTLTEMWRSGSNLAKLRQQYGSWWEFLDELGEAQLDERSAIEAYAQWFRDLTTTSVSKGYKLVLLQTLLEHKAIMNQSSVQQLARWAYQWFADRPDWQQDLPGSLSPLAAINASTWQAHWRKMPITHWCTAERSGECWFHVDDMNFSFQQTINVDSIDSFIRMTQEILDWRFAQYASDRLTLAAVAAVAADPVDQNDAAPARLAYFPDIQIACGHFKTGYADTDESVAMPKGFGQLSQERHFIARASGNSMNGGKSPIYDGDYLLLEYITAENAGKISDQIVAIERQDFGADNQYLLRKVLKNGSDYTLRANNPNYEDIPATEEMVTFARFKGKVDPLELFVGREFMREEIPPLFGVEFNPGNWQSGHVVLADQNAHVLLVTLNKQGKSQDHRYNDYFMDPQRFHWQSQNSTTPESKRGRELINHARQGIKIYLFVRQDKLRNKKAAPFQFHGAVIYSRHEGSAPMSIEWTLDNA
jgi:superfamily II DNA or RNA helicase